MNTNSIKNKSKFILNFIGAILEGPPGLLGPFKRESWHYKNLRSMGLDPDVIYQGVRNLKHRRIIKENDGRFVLTNEGVRWIKSSAYKYFLTKRNWDKKWRVVIFDIPQELHLQRIKFGRKLKSLGFYMLQKSVFVFPYECKEELGPIAEDLGVSDYIDVITAEDIGFKEQELKKYFSL